MFGANFLVEHSGQALNVESWIFADGSFTLVLGHGPDVTITNMYDVDDSCRRNAESDPAPRLSCNPSSLIKYNISSTHVRQSHNPQQSTDGRSLV